MKTVVEDTVVVMVTEVNFVEVITNNKMASKKTKKKIFT